MKTLAAILLFVSAPLLIKAQCTTKGQGDLTITTCIDSGQAPAHLGDTITAWASTNNPNTTAFVGTVTYTLTLTGGTNAPRTITIDRDFSEHRATPLTHLFTFFQVGRISLVGIQISEQQTISSDNFYY